MKIEVMIYVYIAICVSMMVFNVVCIFVLKHRAKALTSDSEKYEKLIREQLERIKNYEPVTEKHKTFLKKVLQKTSCVTAFDKALDGIYASEPELVEKYCMSIYPVFEYLTYKYISKDTLQIAYFPYILHKYGILKHEDSANLKDVLFELLRSVNVYCRENTLKAIYGMQNPEMAAEALKVIDKNLYFHHPKLVCDGLLTYKGDKETLKECLLENFDAYSVRMQLNILNYFRFGNVRCDEKMLGILTDEKADNELRYSAIRYFEKYPCDEAGSFIRTLAENLEGRPWEYQSIASSALKSYPGDVTFRILVANLSNSQWYIRQNSAVSLEKLGYTYHDLISVFDGNDRYAREIMRYRLDTRNAQKEAVNT